MVPNPRASDLPQLATSTQNIPDDSIDCGIRRLNWCSGPTCQQYARLRTFVTILAIAGALQGACEAYFRISAKEAALEYGWNSLLLDWLLVSSGIFQAIFALVFTYWAHRLHPISWLSGIIVLQSLVCVIAVIPSIYNFSEGVANTTAPVEDDNLCSASNPVQFANLLSPENSKIVTLILLFVLQLFLGLASMGFYTIGVTYIDDNSQSIDSPAVIAVVLGAKILGLQFGSLLLMAVDATDLGWWLGWVIIAPTIFVTGTLLGLFPKRLPKTVIHQAAQRIIEESRNRQFGGQFATYIDDIGFMPSLKRIFANKLLMFNIVSIMFIQGASINYALQEESYLQSRFYLPFNEEDGLTQEWQTKFIAFFLKPPAAAISMIIAGLVISKMQLSGRKIASINMGMCVKLLATYIAFIFISCDVGPIAAIRSGKLEQPYCSSQCICKPTSFLPVCPENSTVTYFSPCYAGCTTKSSLNNVEIYEDCTCGGGTYESNPGMRATIGACSAENCSKMLLLFQILSISTAVIFGITTIGKIIINLRSVLPQDKGLALAMEVMFVGLFAYVPAHLAYEVASRETCIYWAPKYERCLMRETPKHGNIINILTASLILIGLVFDILVFVFIKDLNIYNCKVTDLNYTPSLYAPIPRNDDDGDDEDGDGRTLHTAAGGSPVTTMTTASLTSRPRRPAPTSGITVFRQPSSVTNSSAGESSIVEPATSGLTYAQVVFPPDKHKPNDGSTSPKRLAVKADVPLHHLSEEDVREHLNNLKTFKGSLRKTKPPTSEDAATNYATIVPSKVAETNLDAIEPESLDYEDIVPLNSETTTTAKGASPPQSPQYAKINPLMLSKKPNVIETDLDEIRPQSPETDF